MSAGQANSIGFWKTTVYTEDFTLSIITKKPKNYQKLKGYHNKPSQPTKSLTLLLYFDFYQIIGISMI